jgi:hypothetical protein
MAKPSGRHQNEALCDHHILLSGTKKTQIQLFQTEMCKTKLKEIHRFALNKKVVTVSWEVTY